MRYTHTLFDLDGTVIRSEEGILNSVAYALEKMGKPIPAREVLLGFIGPPLIESFAGTCGFPPEEAARATELYRERYSVTGLYECELYPGIRQLLEALTRAGCAVHLATAKPEVYARPILEHLGVLPFFTTVAGITLGPAHQSKEGVIRRVMAENGLRADEAVMVGDRHHDAEGAAACGMDCIGVLYGYGSAEELRGAGARYLAADAAGVGEIVLG